MKTHEIVSQMNNEGIVFAVERDKKRMTALKKSITTFKLDIVEVRKNSHIFIG